MTALSTHALPLAVHDAARVRALDRYAIETLRIPSYTLMTRAGAGALAVLRRTWPDAARIVVVCGPGNNGGDGYALARFAREQRLAVVLVSLCDGAQLQGDAARACRDFVTDSGTIHEWNDALLDGADVIVDAVFGTGLSRRVDDGTAAKLRAINAAGPPVLALDVPSGLHADTGEVLGAAIRAQCTVAFIALKLGFYLGSGPDHVGRIEFDDLDLAADTLSREPAVAQRIDAALLARTLPPRARTAHKGKHGDVLVVGGGIGMPGAARLAGEAALRCGAGRVTVATHEQNVAAIVAGRPELMCRGIREPAELEALIERADVLAIGPGLGRDDWSQAMWRTAIAARRTCVIDADALNLLAQSVAPLPSPRRWILTPHPGEAARLLGTTGAEIQADRLGAAHALAEKFEAVVVLKGACSLVVANKQLPVICDRGNPGMATAGMGDVLTGVIAGICGQTADLFQAACVGVLLHAMAGDRAAERGERGLIASDLFEHLPVCANPTANR